MTEQEREYAVVSWHPKEGTRFAGPGFGASWTTEEKAKEWFDHLTGYWRGVLRTKAEENEASGFKGGNWDYMTWKEKEPTRFAIISRPYIKPPAWEFEVKEEGFDNELG